MTMIVEINAELLNSKPTIHLGGNMHVYIKVAYSQQKNQPPEGG
ncbi:MULTISPECIES: hypothetical protein [Acinetobacter]|nr:MULTISPECIES: hypothetical protein [Acinetobacter]MDD4853220.1 hypothetical protein [Acinetobacter towneri]MDV2454717.1 hypothetical protein [Acinetobacter towneri]MDV2484061.1 hypothetical protein [Acinetobacter towneri]WPC31298.1 hypothetical protein O4J62_08670 [Acinetobacter towneri]